MDDMVMTLKAFLRGALKILFPKESAPRWEVYGGSGKEGGNGLSHRH